jgi:UDP-N-acetylglucosamine--N-acetylmuramyl-(pentapeptide) pyrophosphoryl-undecaprenol N-acetylglucosamine transferase
VVLVVGGSQGSTALNRLVLDAVRGVVLGELDRRPDVSLLWATGPANFPEVQASLRELGDPSWVHLVGYIQEMPEALSFASLALSRAGAMTTSEFLAWGIPAILVPLPSAAADHQSRNAESLEASGAAVHLPESTVTGPSLWRELEGLFARPEALAAMRAAALDLGRPEAATEIARALSGLIPVDSEVRAQGSGRTPA